MQIGVFYFNPRRVYFTHAGFSFWVDPVSLAHPHFCRTECQSYLHGIGWPEQSKISISSSGREHRLIFSKVRLPDSNNRRMLLDPSQDSHDRCCFHEILAPASALRHTQPVKNSNTKHGIKKMTSVGCWASVFGV